MKQNTKVTVSMNSAFTFGSLGRQPQHFVPILKVDVISFTSITEKEKVAHPGPHLSKKMFLRYNVISCCVL